MGIFSTPVMESAMNFESDIVKNESLQDLMEDSSLDSVYSESADLEECALNAVIDMNENFNMIQKAIGCQELTCLESTGQDFEYTEPVLEGFVDTIKNFLKKIWEKIKALFKRFMMMFDSFAKNDKEFVTKYKKEIYSGKDLSDFEFKGYKFTIDKAISTGIKECKPGTVLADAINKAKADDYTAHGNYSDASSGGSNEKYQEKYEKWLATVASACGDETFTSLDEGEFSKALHSQLRNKQDEKEELDDFKNLPSLATELMTSSQAKKDLKAAYKETETNLKTAEKDLNSASKTLFNNIPNKDEDKENVDDNDTTKGTKGEAKSKKAAALNYYLKWVHASKSTLIKVDGAILNAIKERSRQNKAIITKAVYYKPKGESSYTESASNYSASVGDFLGGIVLK